MESQEQKDEKKNANKALSIFAAVFIVAAAAFAAYKTGVIPGFGANSKVANELKASIESARGTNIKNKIITFYQNTPGLPEEMKKSISQGINESVDISFEYADLKTSSGEGKGTVEIDAPKLLIKPIMGGEKSAPIELRADKLFISRDVNDAEHYFFHSEGNLDIYADASGTGTPSKVLTITAEMPYNEFHSTAGMVDYMKSSAKNLKMVEGRGNTVIATIGDVYVEGSRKKTGAQIDAWGKASYKNIIPGDMIKMMLGATDPLSFNMDYAYKGDDYNEQFAKLMEYSPNQQADRVKAMQDPNYKPSTTPPPEFQPFDGAAKLNDFSIMMGDAGVSVKGDATFKKDNPKIIPTGSAMVKIAQYQKLIDYLKRFFPVPQEQVDKTIKMLSEIGENSGGNITVDLKFDGTENILVGGKTTEQIKAIEEKYYPAMPMSPSPDGVKASPPPVVKGKPMIENGTKI